MTSTEKAFSTLRVNFRKNGYFITENVYNRFHPGSYDVGEEICVFCGSNEKLTKEHVFPKWFFEGKTNVVFISKANQLTQTYNKAVIPCCQHCNNSLLAKIEKSIFRGIQSFDFNQAGQDDFLCDIIRWLEILDYKCQVYSCRRKYIKSGNSEYDPFWGILPLAVMEHFNDFAPFRPFDHLRNTQRRITRKQKNDKIDSLLVFEMSRPNLDFFVKPTKYIYVSMPFRNIAFFHFFRQSFSSLDIAAKQAKSIMKKVAET